MEAAALAQTALGPPGLFSLLGPLTSPSRANPVILMHSGDHFVGGDLSSMAPVRRPRSCTGPGSQPYTGSMLRSAGSEAARCAAPHAP